MYIMRIFIGNLVGRWSQVPLCPQLPATFPKYSPQLGHYNTAKYAHPYTPKSLPLKGAYKWVQALAKRKWVPRVFEAFAQVSDPSLLGNR